jgi:membrane dipeptidase
MLGTLDRRRFIYLSTLAAAGAAVPPAASSAGAPDAKEAARPAVQWTGYDKAMVIDALGSPGDGDVPFSAAAVADIRASGVTALNLTVGALGSGEDAFEQTFKYIGLWEREIDAHPDLLLRIRTGADLETARASRRLGIIYGFQDATPLGDDPERVELFSRFGVRILQLTYNRRNLLGDGCLEPGNAGLSRLGLQVVEQMNKLGVLVDLSHCGHRTTLDGIQASKRPAAITHTGCAAVTDFPRNKTDEELRLLAQRGGVVGIYFMPFLRAKGQPTADDVIAHLEHAVDVCGEDHVGLGTDGGSSRIELTPAFKQQHREFVQNRRKLGVAAPGEEEDVYNFVPDLNTPHRFETLAGLLLQRGHKEARVEKILGGNFARLFRESWHPA